jgi:hypothetical protein
MPSIPCGPIAPRPISYGPRRQGSRCSLVPPGPRLERGKAGRPPLWRDARQFLRVLESLIFDFQNYQIGRLDPSYEGIAAKTGLGRSTVALALARLRDLRIIHWVRRCERHWKDGRFELRQRTNAYVLLPPSQWLGLDPQPAEAPLPETGTWGDHPPLPDVIGQAINERKRGANVDTALTVLEQDATNPVALATARLFRSVLARETAAKPLNSSGVRISD